LTQPLASVTEAELMKLTGIAERLAVERSPRQLGQRPDRNRPGVGNEFLDFRDYAAGDDARAIDWRASARSRQPQVRRYQREASSDWYLCLDGSASMNSADGAKWALAVQLCAAFSYLLLHVGQRVGVLVFSDRIDNACALGRGRLHYSGILRVLQTAKPRRQGGGSALRVCAGAANQGNPLMVISDFLTEDAMLADLSQLRDRVVHAVQVLSAAEVTLPPDVLLTLRDIETLERLSLQMSPAASEQAATSLADLQQQLTVYCRRRDIALSVCRSGQSWQSVSVRHLSKLLPSHG